MAGERENKFNAKTLCVFGVVACSLFNARHVQKRGFGVRLKMEARSAEHQSAKLRRHGAKHRISRREAPSPRRAAPNIKTHSAVATETNAIATAS